ncbi:MAG TPA: xanthine dehydrogenase family protein molybdopterin-binding subunit [Chloroflexota bacterium]
MVAVPERTRHEGPPVTWADEPRVDARDKVTGEAKYVEDLPGLPGMVYAACLRSPYSHARVVAIDTSRAEALPGVVGVLDRAHLDGVNPRARVEEAPLPALHGTSAEQGFITTDKARFQGDLLGMVAAVDRRTAERAIELIDVEYEVLPPLFSAEDALQPDAPLIHEALDNNLALEDQLEWGDVDAGLAQAEHVFEESFSTGTIFQHPMEPAGSCIASVVGESADLWVTTEKPYGITQPIAALLGIKPENVRVRVPYVGGGFGAKQLIPPILATLALARRVGRPVKYVASDEESFRANARHAMVYTAKVGVRADGTLVALVVDLEIDTGAYFTGAASVTRLACLSAWGCHRLPHFRVRARTAYTNRIPAGHFRATGKTQTTFGIECTMDRVARRLGLTPYALRLKNVMRRGEAIASTWKVQGETCPADAPPMDMDFPDMMRRAVAGIGWDGEPTTAPLAAESGERRRLAAPEGYGTRRVARGRGMALSLRQGARGVGRTYAEATLGRDGTIRIAHNAPDLGTGVYTIISVVAARTLGVPQRAIIVGEPDTSNDLPFYGTNSQRTTVQMGNAVQAACEALKRELADAAAQAYGGSADAWRVADGRVWREDANYSFADVVRAFKGDVALKGMGSYSARHSVDGAYVGLDHWSPGAAVAEVEVDLDTGEVRVLQYAAVADAGKTIHHLSARRQVEGGLIMGLGNALFEELRYEEGQLQNADAFQYRLPILRDVPPTMPIAIVENGDGPGPFGAKGMSQTSIPCVAPAINNAIYDAVGVHLRSVPFTPEKLLRALGELEDVR